MRNATEPDMYGRIKRKKKKTYMFGVWNRTIDVHKRTIDVHKSHMMHVRPTHIERLKTYLHPYICVPIILQKLF